MKYCVKCGNQLLDEAVLCTKCGNQLLDEAVLCTKCGCTVNSEFKVTQDRGDRIEKTKRNGQVLPAVFNFIFDLFVILSIASLAMSVAWAYVQSRANASVYNYIRKIDVDVSVQSHLYYEDVMSIMAMIGSFAVVSVACISFILTLINRPKMENLFSSIKRLVLGIALVIVSIAFVFS